uniref:HAP2 n=1 Tax=Arundo donax TaxID=35708 RepID=A0A0A9GV63_ARUDO
MLLERVRFTDGRECNKIGVSYEAFQNQPDFCSSPFSSCLYNQLWNFWEDDKNRVNMSLPPQYIVEGKFQRINQHPGAGVHTFSVGVTEGLNSNLLLELSADDIEYVYQRSPGKIISINVPTFEALTQVGTAKVTTKNIGKLEASYSLTFRCLSGISYVEEQFFIMKPDEGITRSFYLRASTDQAAKFHCAAILKASDFSELDREECQFSTRATVFDNGTQIGSSNDHKKGGIWGFFEAVKAFWHTIWDFVMDFFTGRSCSTKCSSVFDLSCHIQYICIGWIVMVGLLLAMVPTVAVLLWLLHQNGLFDPLYNWWEDLFGLEPHGRAHTRHKKGHHHRHSHRHGDHHHTHHAHPRRTNHHHVLHRHGEQQPGTAAAEGHRRHRHDAALGVQHREVGGHKHRHGKAAAELHLDGPRRQAPSSWLRGEEDGEVYRDRRRHERHAGHGQHDRERRHSRAV